MHPALSTLKQALGLVGILTALVGIGLDSRLLIWVALGVLGASVLVRIVLAVLARARAGAAPKA